MLALPFLLALALLPRGGDAGALPLFFRHLRLPYFGHGAGGRSDTKLLLTEHAGQSHPQSSSSSAVAARRAQGSEPGIRPLDPNEEAKRKEQQGRQHQHQHSSTSSSSKGQGGAKIIVPPPTAATKDAGASSSASSAHPHVHHWGLRGDGYHAVMAGRWTAGGQWHALEVRSCLWCCS